MNALLCSDASTFARLACSFDLPCVYWLMEACRGYWRDIQIHSGLLFATVCASVYKVDNAVLCHMLRKCLSMSRLPIHCLIVGVKISWGAGTLWSPNEMFA